MSTPAIGYEESTTLTRAEIARLQLVEAIRLFVDEKFLPALTLAGAAEEIFGKLLAQRSDLPAIKKSVEVIMRLREVTGLSVMANKSESGIVAGWNEAKNAAKHLANDGTDLITLNLCDEAYWMIRRALDNAARLPIDVDRTNFDNWFVINVG